jgi:ferredoxin-NADP reductase
MAGPLSLELRARSVIAPGIVDLTFAMRVPERLAFRAGQFVSLAIGSSSPDEIVSRRSYSIASQSDAGETLRLIIRVIPNGRASDYLMTLPLGATVNMTGPHGFFVLDAVHPGDIVFGATGTGIAAVLPMLGELARGGAIKTPTRIVVFWGLRHEADIFRRDEIETLAAASGAQLSIHLSAPGPDWRGGRGRINSSLLGSLRDLTAPTFYLVGNGAMITEVTRELVSRGVDRKARIRTEVFFD